MHQVLTPTMIRYELFIKPKRPPPVTEKSHSALRFGILGAARVAPDAIIHPAKTHPDVVISAVACRDKHRGLEYAQKHHIERTFSGAQAYHGQCCVGGQVLSVRIQHASCIMAHKSVGPTLRRTRR